ncbi:hypothetical protein QAD02_004881 [Eretmocerus hayati]|uniref:Uncharacterized protein n=1 Tax=Eretmocerus hayati TaxID=131215 RepID=A0ACC2NR99_9HYME|nr:hypothetical protein QAD02_004881 [Eretmocerus hayati]
MIKNKYAQECSLLGGSSSGAAAEAEDSSYDSDYEAEDVSQTSSDTGCDGDIDIGHRTEVQPIGKLSTSSSGSSQHSDVSRTASDTLAAEFAEYVTVHQNVSPSVHIHSPGYTARVEFALKLGYTERLVQAALAKLGPEPAQNELLAELIRLGANSASTCLLSSSSSSLSSPSLTTTTPRLADTADETEALLPEIDASSNGLNSGRELRPVVIDGSNVAMSHGNKHSFSCRGIKICVDWFRARGHREITVFVPKWRKESPRPDNPVLDQEILGELERERLLVFTPSRLVGGKRMVCYDDRYILRLAAELDGIVVSNDNYRDLAQENPEFRKVVEERILMYSFVNDRFMPPDDPLGRSGPTLDNFLKVAPSRRADPAPPCPYAKKCTYGAKCKFRHPERGPHPHKSVTERLVEHAKRHLQARGPSLSLPLPLQSSSASVNPSQQQHPCLTKTRSNPSNESLQPTTTSPITTPSQSVDSALSSTAQAYASSHGWMAPRVANAEPEPANMHRKLQRQLSLNPTCDPRLSQMNRYQQQPQIQQQHLQMQSPAGSQLQQQLMSSSSHSAPLQNRQLHRQASFDSNYNHLSVGWDQQQQQQSHPRHQHVTRIASAPDSNTRGWPPTRSINASQSQQLQQNQHRQLHRLNASDSQLNDTAISSLWPNNSHQQQHQQEARRHLYYHLANVFPEEQVRAAMNLHPHETDPQQICAAILSMYPKH